MIWRQIGSQDGYIVKDVFVNLDNYIESAEQNLGNKTVCSVDDQERA